MKWEQYLSVLSVKNPSPHVLSFACFSRKSFQVCLLQINVPSYIFLNRTFFTYVTIIKTLLRFAPEKNHHEVQLTIQENEVSISQWFGLHSSYLFLQIQFLGSIYLSLYSCEIYWYFSGIQHDVSYKASFFVHNIFYPLFFDMKLRIALQGI